MKKTRVGLVGIGKLGTALMTHWAKNNEEIGIYHPIEVKAEQFIEKFQNGYLISERELGELDVLILAISAKDVIPFITNLKSSNGSLTKTYMINMATALNTKEIKSKFPWLNVVGIKYMGHARDLLDHGNGLFITETTLPKQVEGLFQSLGQIKIDREDHLIQVNKLATYYAIKAALEIESEFAQRHLSSEYVQRALTSIAPEVIRSYSEGNLGHFAKEIVKEIRLKNTKIVD